MKNTKTDSGKKPFDYDRAARLEAQRIYDRVESGKVRCACGAKARVDIRGAGGCSMRQSIRLYCDKCEISTMWRDDHYMIEVWKEWIRLQLHRRKLKRKCKN